MGATTLTISFTTREKIGGLVRDQQIPLRMVRDVEVVSDGLAAVRGVRAPGLALPGRNKIGTWRSREGKSLVAVRAHQPALKVTLAGHRYSSMLITADAPDELAESLSKALGGAEHNEFTSMTRSREIAFKSGEHALAGTLTVPPGAGPFPAVLLIPGSGPIDRDSNHKRMPLDITGQLADALAAAGLATLRFDKRGVGASSGRWRATGFYDNRDDACAALEFLAGCPDVDPARMIILGHSEGALHAANLAAGGTRVAGVVLLSCSATSGETLLRWQSAQIAPTLPRAVRALLRLLRTDLEARTAKTHVKIKATTSDEARVEGVKMNARWLREFMAHDPRADLARMTAPVLAVTGSKDLQVPASDLASIAKLVRGPVATREVANLSHILRTQPGPASLSGYKREMQQPLDSELVNLVVDWTHNQVSDDSPWVSVRGVAREG